MHLWGPRALKIQRLASIEGPDGLSAAAAAAPHPSSLPKGIRRDGDNFTRCHKASRLCVSPREASSGAGLRSRQLLCCGMAAETGGATEAERRKSGDNTDSGQIGKMWSAVSAVQNRWCNRLNNRMEYSKKDLFCWIILIGCLNILPLFTNIQMFNSFVTERVMEEKTCHIYKTESHTATYCGRTVRSLIPQRLFFNLLQLTYHKVITRLCKESAVRGVLGVQNMLVWCSEVSGWWNRNPECEKQTTSWQRWAKKQRKM